MISSQILYMFSYFQNLSLMFVHNNSLIKESWTSGTFPHAFTYYCYSFLQFLNILSFPVYLEHEFGPLFLLLTFDKIFLSCGGILYFCSFLPFLTVLNTTEKHYKYISVVLVYIINCMSFLKRLPLISF